MAVDTMELKRRLETQIASRKTLDSTFDQVEKWVGPLSGGLSPEKPNLPGSIDWERVEVWDSTGAAGSDKLVAFLSSSITNPAVRWMRRTWLDRDLQENTNANEWLDDSTDVGFAELEASDFYTEMGKFYGDWVRYNTACFVAEAKKDAISPKEWEGFDFTAPPIRECFYEPDCDGKVLRWWRVLNWTAGQILSKWPDGPVPQRVRDMAADPARAIERLKIAYAIYVRPELRGKKKEKVLAPELRPVGSCYFLVDSGEMCGEERGYYEMPVYVVPWSQAAGSDWGTGPGIRSLPDVRTLNDAVKTMRTAARKAVDPSFTVTERGLMSDVNMKSGGMTVVASHDDIKPFESGSKYAVGEHDIADQRAIVRGHFWVDELTLKLSPQMTATEVNARIDMMQKLFGPTLSNLQSAALDPLVELVFASLFRAGKLPPMPPEVKRSVEEAGGEFRIQYEGPLSRAQRIDEVASIERLGAAASAFKKMEFADIDLVFDAEQAMREIAKRLGTPAVCLRSATDVKKASDAQKEMQRKAMAAEVARAQGEAVAQQAEATGAVQSVPAQPTPIVSPEAGGGL
jgi:hypothetical protein